MVGIGHSRAQRQEVAIGGDRDGTIRAVHARIVGDAGAYPVVGPLLVGNTGVLLPGPYRVPAVSWETAAVVTNTTPVVAYRGAGRPEAAALMERAVDLFAAEAGLDPLAVRRHNLLRADELPYTNPNGVVYDSGDYLATLDLALADCGWDDLRAEQARRRERGDRRQLGLGLATFVDRTSAVPGAEYGSVELRADGTVLVVTASTPYGQGHRTSWAMLVADRTGIALDRIEVVHGDTDLVPRGGITGGSKSVQKSGAAVALAADQLVEEARMRVAATLEAAVDDVVLDLEHARFHVAGAPGVAAVSWSELAATLDDDAEDDALKCEQDFEGGGPTVPFGAYIAVVEVDTETGEVQLVRAVTVDDAGTILNPLLAEGQVQGGVAQGVGQALYEEFVYDDQGTPLTSTFADYLLPSAPELPPFEGRLFESPSPLNPLGAKGIAESGTIGATPAVQNAVVDALSHLGVRHIDLPVTPEKVWRALRV
jgi:carbon-monoxide dehydrogenase large subunit